MCPPVSVRRGARGTSYLYGAWLYQLVHGEQMKMCFTCFRAAFLLNKFYLEMGYWKEEELSEEEEEEEEEEVGDAEPMEHLSESESLESDSKEDVGSEQDAGSEQNTRPKRDAWQGVGSLYVPQSVSEYGGPGTLVPTPLWTEWVIFSISVPTELLPQEAVPLDLGPEDAEWTEALPWRLNALFPCSHRLIPPLSWWDIFDVMPSPGQPVLLEVRSLWPLDQSVAQTWLQDQKFVLLLDSIHFMCHLLSLHVRWAVRTQVQHWQVLLNPGEMWVAHLRKVLFRPRGVYPWSLNVLKRSDLGMELVPAAFYLRKKGFWLGSFLPWHNSIPETWSRDPGERLFITDATVCTPNYHFAQTFFP